jgi:Rieske Fe-S protein
MTIEPLWKRDFPVAWAEDHRLTRRQFARSLACFSCAAAAAVLAAQAGPETERAWPAVSVGRLDELAPGEAKVFGYPEPGEPCLLIRLEADRVVAFAQRCTHLACPVLYRAEDRRLHCPCHEGFFDAESGAVLAGPPPRPLPQVVLERRGQELWAVGMRVLTEETR